MAIFGTLLKVHFLEKYTPNVRSNQAKNDFEGLKKLFWGESGYSSRANTGIWLFARENILDAYSQEIYVQRSSNQAKNVFFKA